MASDFFQRQDRARRHTLVLIAYLGAAVILIALSLNLVAFYLLTLTGNVTGTLEGWLREPWFLWITGGTVAVVAGGSAVRYLQLRGGGRSVAELVGAIPVDPATSNPRERVLVNVVEEMAIASGTPVPELYVLEREGGINAFVAGFRPTEAVLVVTRGALEHLDRDQLQGVMGHEFSHILNGDMRINIRLMAILNGIFTIGLLGRVLLRGGVGGRAWRYDRGSRRGSGGHPALLAGGLAMILVGYIGLFFGRLIKAAVSRQREFLADASAVQFTRNPQGIAGALWRIREHATGSHLRSTRAAEETSHMCFEESMSYAFSGLFATHPPVDERIRAIDPHYFARQSARRIRAAQVGRERQAGSATAGSFLGAGIAPLVAGGGAALAATVGTVSPAQMDYAVELRRNLPEAVMNAVHQPGGAPQVLYALLLREVDPERFALAEALLRHREGEEIAAQARRLHDLLEWVGARAHLPLVELALPALRRLDPERRKAVIATADRLARIDRNVNAFEFALLVILRKHLAPNAGREQRPRYFRYAPVMREIRQLLSMLARAGSEDEVERRRAFERGALGFGEGPLEPMPADQSRPEDMQPVLERLGRLAPVLKRPLIEACAECALSGGVRPAQAELLRAVCEILDCPMPPLVETVRVRGGL